MSTMDPSPTSPICGSLTWSQSCGLLSHYQGPTAGDCAPHPFSRFRWRRAPSTARLGCAPAPNLRSSATSHGSSTVAAVSAELPPDNWNRGGRRGNFLNRCGTHQEQRAHLLQLQPHEPFPSSRACSSNPWPNGLSCHNWCSELAPPLVPSSLHPSCMTCSVSCHPCRSQTRLPCQISHRSWDVRATPVRAMSRSTKCNLETQRRSVPVRAMSWRENTECERERFCAANNAQHFLVFDCYLNESKNRL
jgi:hypothetical protein